MDTIKEIETAFYNIPFGNSDFQNAVFVLAAQQTPARAYRALGLRLHEKLNAINELKYARQLEEIDIEEKEQVISSFLSSSFDKRRARVEIDKILSTRNYTDKLLNDAIHDLDFMYAQFQKYPRYTREQFEDEERLHYETILQLQLTTDLNPVGAKQSLAYLAHSDTIFPKLLNEANNALLENKK